MKNIKVWINLGFFALAVALWFFVRQLLDTILTALRLPWLSNISPNPADVAGVILGIGLFVIMNRSRKVNEFVEEAIVELSKVTWPPRKETVLSTGVILVMLAICATLLFGFDTLWGTVVAKLYTK